MKIVRLEKAARRLFRVTAAEGDAAPLDGLYLVALNKWSIDRLPM